MQHLRDILDEAALVQAIAQGYITRRPHPTADLFILNYTPKAAYEHVWTTEMQTCRGLIVDGSGVIHARAFDKFFNLGELPATLPEALPSGSFEVTEKLDGSLGVSYLLNGQVSIATRGSFISDQAQWATAHWHSTYAAVQVPASITLIFEIVYPANRIVLDYGQTADLFLIGARDLTVGDLAYHELEALADQLRLPLVPIFQVSTVAELAELAAHSTGAEGWVVRFANGLRVKIKTAEYLQLARILSNFTPNYLRDLALTDAAALNTYLVSLPDEFQQEGRAMVAEMQRRVSDEEARLRALYLTLAPLAATARKDFALAVMQHHKADSSQLFALLDGRDIRPQLLKALDLATTSPIAEEV